MGVPSTDSPDKHDEEITLAAALKRLLTEERFTDVSLRGTDSKIVRASRTILSSRSKVFEKMLMVHFEESSSAVVSVDYKGDVLQAVVEYVYTDQADILQTGGRCDVATAKTLASVAVAASNFGLSKLCQKAQDACCQVMSSKPYLASVFWSEFQQACLASTARVQQYAMDTIRANPRTALLDVSKMILAVLNPCAMKAIVGDDRLMLSELDRFRVIQAWAQALCGKYAATDDISPQRKEEAHDMTTMLHLDRIDPADLATIVNPSGLVATTQLLEAYQAQALQAKRGVFSFPTMRFDRWEHACDAEWTGSSSSWVTDTICCPPLRSGVYQWTVHISNCGGNMMLGVLLSSASSSGSHNNNTHSMDSYIGDDAGSWGYRYNGQTHHNGIRCADGPQFGDGSSVTMKLDLRKGTLSASVDGGKDCVLFSHLKLPDHIPDITAGFVPAASLRNSGSIRLVGISDLEE